MRFPGRRAKKPAKTGQPAPLNDKDGATPWKDDWPTENGLATLRLPSKRATSAEGMSTGAVCSECHAGPRRHAGIKKLEAQHNKVIEDDPDDPWLLERRNWKAGKKLQAYNDKLKYVLTHDPDDELILPVPRKAHSSAGGSKLFPSASTGSLPKWLLGKDEGRLTRKPARAIDAARTASQLRMEETKKKFDMATRQEGPHFAGSSADQMIKAWSADRCMRYKQEKYIDVRDGFTLRQCLRVDDDIDINTIIRRAEGEVAATALHTWLAFADNEATSLSPKHIQDRVDKRYPFGSDVVPETSLARRPGAGRRDSTDSPPVLHSELVRRQTSRYSRRETQSQKIRAQEAAEMSFEQAVDKFDGWLERHLQKAN